MADRAATTYRPSTGARFLTRDPIEALTRSAYGYAGNDPINTTDPTGMCPWCIVGGWALVEVGFSLWDAYDAYTTFNDDCAGGLSKAAAGGFFLLGLFGPGGGYGTLDEFSQAGRLTKKANGLSAAGHGAQKHGDRGLPGFPRSADRTVDGLNSYGQHLLDDLLTSPTTARRTWMHPGHGQVTDFIGPNYGARFGPWGNFIGFL